jgi:hypothetical protein
MLVFLVMFGPKKGSVVAYKSGWYSLLDYQLNTIISTLRSTNDNNISKNLSSILLYVYALIYRFNFTTVTSRSTSYFLFTFWVFFFFFGEVLLLLTFNFSAPVDTISSSSFFTIKQHTAFYLNSLSNTLLYHINIYIYFLTSSAILYLINLNYSYSYNYFKQLL